MQDDFYPKGPSVQFYKMFLDEDVRDQLAVYDALAIIEWDVLVASDRSFAELYHASFDTTEDFWVKGSNLEGTSFHHDATSTDMWHMLGHINGNAIYNNNDPAFVEYVDYTLSRWEYKYAYDVALWATISDFPYSWPLWQRYSSKFVTTNLVSDAIWRHFRSILCSVSRMVGLIICVSRWKALHTRAGEIVGQHFVPLLYPDVTELRVRATKFD